MDMKYDSDTFFCFVLIHRNQGQENRAQKQDGQPAAEASHATDTHSASLAHETRPRVLRLHQTQIPQTLQLRRHEPTSGADERKQEEEEEEAKVEILTDGLWETKFCQSFSNAPDSQHMFVRNFYQPTSEADERKQNPVEEE